MSDDNTDTLYDLARDTIEVDAPVRGFDSPRLLVVSVIAHPDVSRVGQRLIVGPLKNGRLIAVSRAEPAFAHPCTDDEPKPLKDRFLSRSHSFEVVVEGGQARVERLHEKARIRVDGEMLDRSAPIDLEVGGVINIRERVGLLVHTVEEEIPRPTAGDLGFVGESGAMALLRRRISRVAKLVGTVLIRGETGVGKELTARALHDFSTRPRAPFVSCNVAAIQPALVASELFGHVRGAFTGAVRDQKGLFRRADGGTLFLDEIGAAPEEVQRSLLRVLETGEVLPVGGDRAVKVDVRVVAATDESLERAVEAETFRAPLLHRLSEYVVKVPPLRARADDIARLAIHYLEEHLDEIGRRSLLEGDDDANPWLSARVMCGLVRHDWPGNVRELRNAIRRMVADSLDSERLSLLSELHAGPAVAERPPENTPTEPPQATGPTDLSLIDGDDLLEALSQNDFKRDAAAKQVGISRTSIYKLIKKHDNIPEPSRLTVEEITAASSAHGGDAGQMASALRVSKRGLKLRMRELGLT